MIPAAHFDHGFRHRIDYEYDHVQRAPLYWLLMLPSIAIVVFALLNQHSPDAPVFLSLGAFLAALALSFRWLRVRDEGDYFAVRYGPVPIFRKRFRYAEIIDASPDRTTLADGWGIHWRAGRGWTFNLWGFDCVRLTQSNGRTVRVGTDDPGGLAAFLAKRLGEIR